MPTATFWRLRILISRSVLILMDDKRQMHPSVIHVHRLTWYGVHIHIVGHVMRQMTVEHPFAGCIDLVNDDIYRLGSGDQYSIATSERTRRIVARTCSYYFPSMTMQMNRMLHHAHVSKSGPD